VERLGEPRSSKTSLIVIRVEFFDALLALTIGASAGKKRRRAAHHVAHRVRRRDDDDALARPAAACEIVRRAQACPGRKSRQIGGVLALRFDVGGARGAVRPQARLHSLAARARSASAVPQLPAPTTAIVPTWVALRDSAFQPGVGYLNEATAKSRAGWGREGRNGAAASAR